MLHTKYQNSRPSSFREEQLWNFHSLFLCSTYDPQGGATFDPGGILWTNLVEVHKEMPHTKYQISTPSSFREEKFWRWASLFLCSNLWPRVGASSDPRGIIWTNFIEVLKEMLYTKYQSSRPSSLRVEELWNFRSLFLCSTYDPRGILWTNLVEVHKDMPHTKYQISMPSSFREENFWKQASLFLCSKLWPLGWGQFWPQGYHMNKLGRGPQANAIYQISKLSVSEKKNFEIFFLCSFFPTCGSQGRPSFDPRGIIWTNLVEVHKKMLHAKYQSFSAYSLGQDFQKFPSLSLCKIWDPTT